MSIEEKDIIYTGTNGSAGYFEEENVPTRDGIYRYMPYRSGSHYYMHGELKEKGAARCYSNLDGGKIFYDVISCPEYGRLELSNFSQNEAQLEPGEIANT